MPVIIVGVAAEAEGEFVVIVAFGITIALDILAEHEAISDVTFRHRTIGRRVIMADDFDICAVGDAILDFIRVLHSSVVKVGYLKLVARSVALHIFIEKQRVGRLAVKAAVIIVGTLGSILYICTIGCTLGDGRPRLMVIPLAIDYGIGKTRFRSREDTVLAGSIVIVTAVRIALQPKTECTLLGYIIYAGFFEIYANIFAQLRAVKVDGDL